MNPPVQQRHFTRYEFVESPILIEIPDLSLVMLEPGNLSWGGYETPERAVDQLGVKLSLPDPIRSPRIGMSVTCDLEVMSHPFPGCAAEIPWAAGGKGEAPWTLGLRISIPVGLLSRFRGAMRDSFHLLRPEE